MWRVIFIENGGGSKMDAPYISLPDGELSHQNLFEAICDVIAPKDLQNALDHPEILALRLLSRGDILGTAHKATTELLLSKPPESMSLIPQGTLCEDIPTLSSWRPSDFDRIGELVNEYLGVTYNPVRGTFGRTRILELGTSDVKIINQSGGQTESIQVMRINDYQDDLKTTAHRLHVDFEMRDVARLNSHYSSSHTLKSAMSTESQLYLSQHIISLAKVTAIDPPLSPKMMDILKQLPPLPTAGDPTELAGLMQQYYDFFERHGTHVVLRVAIGGVLRAVLQVKRQVEDLQSFGVDRRIPPDSSPPLNCLRDVEKNRLKENLNITICRDGGASVASQLPCVLEQYLRNPSSSNAIADWTDVRVRWIDALEKDPVFCSDNKNTEYEWLYNIDGLTYNQKQDLKRASKSYLIARPNPPSVNAISTVPTARAMIQRRPSDRVKEVFRMVPFSSTG